MEVMQVLHMNGGLGETSYTNNSLLQSLPTSLANYAGHLAGKWKPPEFQIHLNDLNGNDCNSIFRDYLPKFHAELRDETSWNQVSPCFVSTVTGSFYGRLFASLILQLVHFSYSLMWLSKIPEEVELLNKDNIYMASASRQRVIDAYYNQFRIDFLSFLRCRSEEVVSGGRMVLPILGRRSDDARSKECCYICSQTNGICC